MSLPQEIEAAKELLEPEIGPGSFVGVCECLPDYFVKVLNKIKS